MICYVTCQAWNVVWASKKTHKRIFCAFSQTLCRLMVDASTFKCLNKKRLVSLTFSPLFSRNCHDNSPRRCTFSFSVLSPHYTWSTTDRQWDFGPEAVDLLSWHQFLKTYFHHNDIYVHSTCSGCLNVSFLTICCCLDASPQSDSTSWL